MKKLLYLIAGVFLMTSMAFAENPVQLSVPGANFPEGDVKGARLNLLYGKTENVTGLNVSVLGLSEVENFKGLQLGFILGGARVNGEFTGASLGLFNWQEGQSKGVNIGLLNYTNNIKGVQLGFVNYTKNESLIDLGLLNATKGDSLLKVGLVNYTGGHSTIDLGFVNYAEATTFQLGLVNATKNLDGLQVGIINYAENGIFPVLPIVNFRKSI